MMLTKCLFLDTNTKKATFMLGVHNLNVYFLLTALDIDLISSLDFKKQKMDIEDMHIYQLMKPKWFQ